MYIQHSESHIKFPSTTKHLASPGNALHDLVEEAPPGGPGSDLCAVSVDGLPVELTTTGVDIHLGSAEPASALPEEADDPEEHDDGDGEEGHEETLSVVDLILTGRVESSVESCDEDENTEDKTEPRAIDTTDGVEGDLVESVTVVGPGLAEADVGKADGAPGEESGETGKSKQPVEDGDTGRGEVDETEAAADKDENGRDEGTTRPVDVGEDLGSVTLLGKSSEGTRATIDTGDTDGDDGDEDDDVHEVVETLETGIATDEHEGRGLGVRVGSGGEQGRVVAVDEKTDEEETEDVEQGDTPEDLLDGTGKSLDRVARLSGGETDKLSTGEGEGGSDEDGAEALEAVLESTGIIPVPGTPVLVVTTTGRTATEDEDEGDDHEDDGSRELEDRRPELLLSVSDTTEDADDGDDNKEDSDPDGDADVLIPVLNGDTAHDELERENDGPLENVVPAHGETPGRIDETGRVGVETTRDRVHNGELTKSEDSVEHHDTNDQEVHEERTGSTLAQSTTGTDEETSTDGTTDGNHVKMASLHGAIQLDHTLAVVLHLEGVHAQAGAGPGILIIEGCVNVGARCVDGAGDRLDIDVLLTAVGGGNRVLGRHGGCRVLLRALLLSLPATRGSSRSNAIKRDDREMGVG
jgi:hypothetical protein